MTHKQGRGKSVKKHTTFYGQTHTELQNGVPSGVGKCVQNRVGIVKWFMQSAELNFGSCQIDYWDRKNQEILDVFMIR